MNKDKLQVLFNVFLVLSLLINLYWGWYFYPMYYPGDVNIPSSNQINNFCNENGFEYGWLDSQSCEMNEVKCFRKVFDLYDYKCLKWR